MATRVTDGDFTTAQPISAVRYSAPIPGVNVDYVAEQDFCQLQANFSPIAVGTIHPTLANFYLMQETPLHPTEVADIMKWTRIYAKVPATHNLPASVVYTFIGYVGNTMTITGPGGPAGTFGRPRFTKTVAARQQFDYFRLDGTTYSSIEDIPVIQEQRYYAPTNAGVFLQIHSDWIGYTTDILYPTPGSATGISGVTNAAYSAYPTRSVYESWIANNNALLASPPVTVSSLNEIVATASELDLWMGNIVRRKTVWILPQ